MEHYLRPEKNTGAVDWERRPEFEISPNHIPWPSTHVLNSTHQKWAPVCRQESSRRCLLLLAPTLERGVLMLRDRVETLCFSFLFSFPPPSFFPFPPFFYALALNNLAVVSHISLQEPKLWERGTFLCMQWCFHSQRLEPTSIGFLSIFVLSFSVWPICV